MFLKVLIALFLICVIAVYDIATYKIPDVMLIILMGWALVFDLVKNPGVVVCSLIFSSLMFLIFYSIYKVFGGIGFGDVKFSGCIAYIFGFFNSILICFAACSFGIIYFIINRLVFNKKVERLPFAPFIFVSTLGVACFNGLLK